MEGSISLHQLAAFLLPFDLNGMYSLNSNFMNLVVHFLCYIIYLVTPVSSILVIMSQINIYYYYY